MAWADTVAGLEGLTPAARARLAKLTPQSVPAGTVLFQPGDAVRGYVIVLEGRVGVHLVGPTGRDILLYDVTPGHACIQSTLGLLGGEDYTGEAVAEEPTRLVLLPRDIFLSLIDDDAAFRAAVFSAFAERLQSMMHLLERVAFLRIESRLAEHLLSHASPQGQVAATHQDLASAIGSAREVISRRLDALQRRGLVAVHRGRIDILDAESLRHIAGDLS